MTVVPVFATVYSDSWAVHIEGGPEAAEALARDHGFIYVNQIMTDHFLLRHPRVHKRSVDHSSHFHQTLEQDSRVKWTEQQTIKRRVKRDVDHLSFNDPQWPKLWYMNRGSGLDMNVMPAYTQWKITGRDVVITILDDGIEKDHPDLKKNYDAGASYDVNDNDNDPQPRYDMTNENRHGTRCAGEVAAEANNGICSVGIAYDAKIGGVRMLDGDVTDAVEAQSISLNPQHIHIYSASWGPDDDGRTVDGPGPLARKAFLDGIKNGRGGLGSVYVWASGNGGQQRDGCNCDGYTNSMYTLSISSASENGAVPWYSEACSSTLATTYSSGQGAERQIITTDLRKQCTESHTGTSASAPLAAGICALALQANRQLTWRDMQHIVVQTAKRANLHADDWVTNGAGRDVSHHFGFGLMDAAAMVELATKWQTVPEQQRCVIYTSFSPKNVPVNDHIETEVESDGCHGSSSEIHYLEHVECVVTLSTSVRGRVELFLVSPQGTRSTLLAARSHDTSSEGFNQWPFMTTHNWGESPNGKWKLEVRNSASIATLKNWTLVMYGTAVHPLTPAETTREAPSITDSVSCKEGEYFLRPFCYSECPNNFYPSNSSLSFYNDTNQTDYKQTRVCASCHPSCVLCTGPAFNECTACGSMRELSMDNQCVDKPAVQITSLPPERSPVIKKVSLILLISFSCFFVLIVAACILIRYLNCNVDPSLRGTEKKNKISDERPLLTEKDDEDDDDMSPMLQLTEESSSIESIS